MPKRLTLHDLAAAAGVGKSTASRALANDPACAEATRLRIQSLARQLGYAPDPALAALVTHRENVRRAQAPFNLAIVSEGVDHQKSGYLANLWDATEAAAGLLGYSLERNNPRLLAPRALAKQLQARGVRGIVWGWLQDRAYLEEFPWDRFAHVGMLLPVVRPAIVRVRDDAMRTVIDAVEACWERGYRRPGLALMTSEGSANDRFQYAGWLLAHAERGGTAPPIWRSTEAKRWSLTKWCRTHHFDVVIGNTEGVFLSLFGDHPRGRRSPACLNLLHPGPGYAGFDCREPQIGQVLIHLLDRQIRHNELGLHDNPQTTLIRRRFLGW